MPSKNAVPAVFVRGIPVEFTDADLSAIFSDIAPVKRSFIVRNPTTRESRGFGFVQFAFEDDAKLAVEKVNGQTVRGAKLFVSVAGTGKEAAQGGAAEAASRKGSEKRAKSAPGGAAAAPADPAAVVAPVPAVRPRAPRPPVKHGPTEEQLRTVALFGLPADFEKARLWKRVRKAADGIQTLEWPVLLSGSETTPVAYILFDRKQHRDKAITKLDKHNLLGATLHAQPGEAVLHPSDAFRSNRLIVRNLRFNSTAADVRKALVDKGVAYALTEIKVPMHGAADKEADAAAGKAGEAADAATPEAGAAAAAAAGAATRNRGFAFIQFATRADADAALKALNEVKVAGRPVAVDWALSQGAFAAAAAATTTEGAVPAADAAVPAAAEPAAAEAAQEEDAEEKEEDEDADEDDDEDEDDEDDDEEEAGSASEDEDDDGVSITGAEGAEGADAAPAAPAAPVYRADGVEAGTTIFLRNVLFESTDKDVYEGLKVFGPLRYARVVMDKESGRPRGTAFVQYYAKESADRALEAGGVPDEHSAPIPMGDAASADAKARRDAALAAAVATARQNGGIKVSGRILLPSRAVNPEEATRLTLEAKGRALADPDGAAAKKFDKRHTYLAYEGNVRPDSEVGKSIPPSDLAKRQNSQKERKTKLASPMFFVSPTRLSIRNMAKGVNDASLRRMCRIAAVAGLKEGLVSPNEGDPRLRAPFGSRIKVQVLMAKVMRENLGGMNAGKLVRPRFEADGVTPLSKGYGFVEFSNHQAALACLRKLNNNPAFTSYAAGGAAVLAKARGRRKDVGTEILGGKAQPAPAAPAPKASRMVDDAEEEEEDEEEGGFDAAVGDEEAAAAAGDALEEAFDDDEDDAQDDGAGGDSDSEEEAPSAPQRRGKVVAAPSRGPVPKGAGLLTHVVPASLAKECPRLIVEFAMEDWREVKKQERKKTMREERLKTGGAGKPAKGSAPAPAAPAPAGPQGGKKRGRAEMEASSAPAPGAGGKGKQRGASRGAESSSAAPPPPKRARMEKGPKRGGLQAGAEGLPEGGPARANGDTRRKKGLTSEDARHDALVASYMTKLFSAPGGAAGGSSSGGAGAAKAVAEGMGKWM